jgi:hypothetical protein
MSGARRLVLSGVALTALLALVAVASHAHRPGGGSGGGSAHAPKLLFEYAASMMFVLFPIGVIVVIWVMSLRRRQRLLEGGYGRRQFLGLLGLVLLAVPVALGIRLYADRGDGGVTPPQLPKPASGGGKDSLHPAHAASAQFQWAPALVLASLLLALVLGFVAALIWRRRRGADWDREAALAAALDEVLSDTLDDLRAERDPRKAVIGAFKRLERTFAAHDVPREEAETPREYVDRALDRLGVSAASVGRLTALYERAKFSRHEIDATMKDDAIEALAGVRAELEEKPEERAAA